MKPVHNAQLAQHNAPNSVKRRYSTANGEHMRGMVRQDKPLPTTAPRSFTTASPSQKTTRGGLNEQRNHPKVKAYIWLDVEEKEELDRIAESEGLSVSQTGRAIIVDGIRKKLRLEKEVLAAPILEAMLKREMKPLIDCLSEYLARSLLETSQLRYLVSNDMYHEALLREGAEVDPQEKKRVTEKFYALLDRSLKEAVKSIKTWNPEIKELVSLIKRWLTGETE